MTPCVRAKNGSEHMGMGNGADLLRPLGTQNQYGNWCGENRGNHLSWSLHQTPMPRLASESSTESVSKPLGGETRNRWFICVGKQSVRAMLSAASRTAAGLCKRARPWAARPNNVKIKTGR